MSAARSPVERPVGVGKRLAPGVQHRQESPPRPESPMSARGATGVRRTPALEQLDNHPNIANAHDYWEEGKTAVMVTRYMAGGTLADLMAGSKSRLCVVLTGPRERGQAMRR